MTRRVLYTTITLAGLAYALYLGYLAPFLYRLNTFDSWQVGDWLINYSNGPVRRGLIGELILSLTPTGISPINAVVILQALLAAALYAAVGFLYWRSDRNPAWTMLILSPAFLLFPALDLAGNSRKELLVLVALAGAAIAVRFGRPMWGLWAALPVFALAVLSHEALVITLPAFVFFAWTSIPRRLARWVIGAYGATSAAAVLLALTRPGTPETVAAVCRTWNGVGITDCASGALGALSLPLTDSVEILVTQYYPGYWTYVIPAALASVPFFVLRFLPPHWKLFAIVVVVSAPLFFIAWDYGRWIFLLTAQLSLIALAKPQLTRPARVPMIAALAFILLWGFNHAGDPLRDGLLISWFGGIPS